MLIAGTLETERSHTSFSGDSSPPVLARVPRRNLPDVLPAVRKRIESVVEQSEGRYSLAGLEKALMEGRWTLWIVLQQVDGKAVDRAVMASQILESVSGQKIASIAFLTGENRKTWLHLVSEFEKAMKAEGCTRMEMTVRKGWQRELPDYRMSHVLLEKDL